MSEEEVEKCKNDKYYFFKKYVLINSEESIMTREQFEGMIISWNNPRNTLKLRSPYSSWDGSLNECGDANEY